MIWGKVQEIIKQAFVFLVVGMVAFSSFADPASAGSSQGNRQTGVTWLLYHQADEYTITKKELILMLSLFQEKIIPIKSTNKYRLNQAVITLCMLGTVLRWAFFGKDEQSVCLKKAVRKWGDSVMIDHIFIFSLLMIWIMLLYHVILAMSGYRYEKKLYKLGKTLRFPEHPPFVSVLVPAHNEEKVIERTVKALCSFDYPEEFFEVIVINDCSTDRTGEILDRLAKRYPMLRPLHIHPPEGGTGKSAALNNGLRHGTNFVIWRDVLESAGGWDEKALAEDTELSIRIYEAGKKICFMPLAVTWEQEPETWDVWLKQRTRWVRGNSYVVIKFIRMIFSLKNKRIMFDICYFFFTYFVFLCGVLISDAIFILSLLGVVNLTVEGPYFIIWVLAYLLFIVEIMVTLEIEKTELTWANLFTVMLMYFTYSQLWIYLVIRGMLIQLKSVLLHEKVVWYKTDRF